MSNIIEDIYHNLKEEQNEMSYIIKFYKPLEKINVEVTILNPQENE